MALAFVCVALLYVKETLAKQQNSSRPSYTRKQRNLDRRVVLIIIGFLFFSPTSIVVLQTFVCETFEDGTQALVADSSIECYTTTHTWSILYAGIMVIVYPIGL
jgi:ABC-type Fe3+ transport system permease subunit